MKTIAFLLTTFLSFSSFASEDFISCTFYIDENKTSIDELEESKYTTTFGLESGKSYYEDIAIRRLLVVPKDDEIEEQKKKALEDVIYLFEKDKREERLDLDDLDIVKTASVEVSDKLKLSARRTGSNVEVIINGSGSAKFTLNFNGYSSRTNPLRIVTSDKTDVSQGGNKIELSQRPYINVTYKQYDTPWFGRNKIKTKMGKVDIGFICKKTTDQGITTSDRNPDLSKEDKALDDIFGTNASTTSR